MKSAEEWVRDLAPYVKEGNLTAEQILAIQNDAVANLMQNLVCRFQIGQAVFSSLDPAKKGLVTGIIQRKTSTVFLVTWDDLTDGTITISSLRRASGPPNPGAAKCFRRDVDSAIAPAVKARSSPVAD